MRLQKNVWVFVFFLLLWLPFLTFKTIYPFYRFGMFAQGVSTPLAPKETFQIYYKEPTSKAKKHRFSATLMGINAENFRYLKRNYFYRGQTEKLLQIAKNRFANGHAFEWELFKINHGNFPADSILVAHLPIR